MRPHKAINYKKIGKRLRKLYHLNRLLTSEEILAELENVRRKKGDLTMLDQAIAAIFETSGVFVF